MKQVMKYIEMSLLISSDKPNISDFIHVSKNSITHNYNHKQGAAFKCT